MLRGAEQRMETTRQYKQLLKEPLEMFNGSIRRTDEQHVSVSFLFGLRVALLLLHAATTPISSLQATQPPSCTYLWFPVAPLYLKPLPPPPTLSYLPPTTTTTTSIR